MAGSFFRFGIPFLEDIFTGYFQVPAILSPFYNLLDLCFAMLSPTMFCFAAAMISLEEADEKTAVCILSAAFLLDGESSLWEQVDLHASFICFIGPVDPVFVKAVSA